MKNNEPRKISLTFLGFFYHFLQLFKVLLKKKKEKLEQCWAPFDFSGPGPGKRARARARGADFAETPSRFWLTRNGFFYYFIVSLTVCRNAPELLFPRRMGSPTTANATELR
jgi:hypothetical protein